MAKIEGTPQERVARYQKRLIPYNIVVIVLTLVAALSLLFAPLIQIDMGKLTDALFEEMNKHTETDEGDSSGTNLMDMVTDTLNFDGVKIGFSTVDVATFAFAKEPLAPIVDNFADVVEESAADLVTIMLKSSVTGALDSRIEEAEGAEKQQLQEIKNNIEKLEGEDVLEHIEALGDSDKPKEEKINGLVDYIAGIAAVSGEAETEMKSQMYDMIEELYDNTTRYNDGKFTVEACICVTLSKTINGDDNQEGGNPADEKVPTTYDELIDSLFNGDGSGEQSSFQNTAEQIGKTMQTASKIAQYFFYAMLFFVAVWLILAVFAIVHTFRPNKRFMMWYVKLFGGIPWLILGLAPLIGGVVIKNLLKNATIDAMLGAIFSFTWISGVCYILLWLISIFWGFPIKHKIRKLNKQIKRGEA